MHHTVLPVSLVLLFQPRTTWLSDVIHVTLPDTDGAKKQFLHETHNKICGSATRTMELMPGRMCEQQDLNQLTPLSSRPTEEEL